MSTYKLKRPCAHCPFRRDVPPYLTRLRTIEIAESLALGAEFPCHETTIEDPTDDGALMAGPDSAFCAGALIVMEKMGQPNQIVRISERLGMYEAEKLDMDAPVVDSFVEFTEHHGGEFETCSVVTAGCEAPAGMLIGGTVTLVEPEGEVHECPACGEPVCDNCSNEEGVCGSCQED